MNPTNHVDQALARTLSVELPRLHAIEDGPGTTIPNRPSGRGWSRREELGHLIDSALVNHVRIVRTLLSSPHASFRYEQEEWVALHRYQEIAWPEIVELWHAHNRIILELVSGIPESKFTNVCKIGDDTPITLGFLIEDYVVHMQHHLDQVLRRDRVTLYPQAPRERPPEFVPPPPANSFFARSRLARRLFEWPG